MNKDILLSGLEERYSSLHIIRERVHSTSIWLLWILLWVSGTIIKIDFDVCFLEKIFLIGIILIAWLVIIKFYYFDLKKWFDTQRKVVINLEDELWFYSWKHSLYPKEWKNFSEWYFFRNNYILVGFWFTILLITTLFFI